MVRKYSVEEKFQIVMESFTDNVSQAETCRRHGIHPVPHWKRGNSSSREEKQHLLRIEIPIPEIGRSRI